MQLRQLAHARTGDKGNIINIAVFAYHPSDYPLLVQKLTAAKVKAFFAEIVKGEVVRYELPHLGALNFVLYDALGGGVTRSLAVDKHGKSFSSALLSMEIDIEVV